MVPDKARNQQRLSLTCLAGRKSESLDACMMFADCVLFWVFFNLKTWFLGAQPSLISLFLPFKNQLTHINYIILRRDLFDYSQECQNCHKTATIAHITASTSKTYFFPFLKMREYHSVKLISCVENSSCEGENLWSGQTSSFTLPEHLSTKNLTKNKYTNDSWQKLNVRVTLWKEMMDYKGYKGHFDNSIIYSCAGALFVSLNEF